MLRTSKTTRKCIPVFVSTVFGLVMRHNRGAKLGSISFEDVLARVEMTELVMREYGAQRRMRNHRK